LANERFENVYKYKLDKNNDAAAFKTKLIQIYTNDVEEAPREISYPNDKGIPVMCIPNMSDKCCQYVNVPEGVLNLGAHRGKCTGLEEPGPRWCLCSCYG